MVVKVEVVDISGRKHYERKHHKKKVEERWVYVRRTKGEYRKVIIGISAIQYLMV